MKWISNYQHPKGWRFEIETDAMQNLINKTEVVVFLLQVVDAAGNEMYDYLQEELDVAQHQAFERWGVPLDSWVEADG